MLYLRSWFAERKMQVRWRAVSSDSRFRHCTTIDHRNRTDVAGVCRPVEQGDARDDVGWFEEMPACQCLLGAGANSDGEDVVFW